MQSDEFDLFIWDPNWANVFWEKCATRPDETPRKSDLTSMQQSLIKTTSEKLQLRNIFISGNGSTGGGNSMELCGTYLDSLTSEGWMAKLPWKRDEYEEAEYKWLDWSVRGAPNGPHIFGPDEQRDGFSKDNPDLPAMDKGRRTCES